MIYLCIRFPRKSHFKALQRAFEIHQKNTMKNLNNTQNGQNRMIFRLILGILFILGGSFSLRAQTFTNFTTKNVVVVDTLTVASDSLIVVADTLTVAADTLVTATDTLAVATDTLVVAADTLRAESAIPEKVSVPLFALNTNFLYEGATVLTRFHTVPLAVGYEIPLGKNKKWSIYSDYIVTVPWHAWNNNATCLEIMHWDLGARWYPGGTFLRPFSKKENRRALDGWYIYAGAGMGYYDYERGGRGYQGEEVLGALGLGYSLSMGKHWNLNIGLGVGPMFSRFRYYVGQAENQHLIFQKEGTFTYFGVTDARIAIGYLFYHKKKDKR